MEVGNISGWSDLPSELLRTIARKLTNNISNYIRFRCVCISWRLAAAPTELAPQIPWLVAFTLKNAGCEVSQGGTSTIFVSNNMQQYFYHENLPETQGKRIYGSDHGWLVMIDNPTPKSTVFSVSLLNPITGVNITLPPLPTTALLDPDYEFRKVLLCSHPAHSQHSQILVAIWTNNRLAFYKHGDNEWTVLDCSFVSTSDIVYFEGKLYFVDCYGDLAELQGDSSTTTMLSHPSPLGVETRSSYMVEAAGDLLLVVWFIANCGKEKFSVYKLTRSSKGNLIWESIGEITSSCITSAVGRIGSVSVRALPDCRGYHIYVADVFPYNTEICLEIHELHLVPGVGRTTLFVLTENWPAEAKFHRYHLDGTYPTLASAPQVRTPSAPQANLTKL